MEVGSLGDGIVLRELALDDLDAALLHGFDRYQPVTRAWRVVDGRRQLVDVPFVDDWDIATKELVVTKYFRETIEDSGMVVCAFRQERVIGFFTLLYPPFGSRGQYADLVQLHVSRESRGRGLGRRLLLLAAERARAWGREALYISAHSAEESQAFYRAVGCIDAAEVLAHHRKAEPFDIQMEYPL